MSSTNLENEDLDNVPLVRMEDVQPSRERTSESCSPSKDGAEVYETCLVDNIEYVNEYVINDEVDDDNSNIGSMVSLQSEDVYEDENSNQELIIPEEIDEVRIGNVRQPKFKVYVHRDQKSLVNDKCVEDSINDNDSCSENKTDDDELDAVKNKYIDIIADHDLDEGHLETELEDCKEFKLLDEHTSSKSTEMLTIEVPPNKKKRVDASVSSSQSERWPTLEILPGGVIKNTDKFVDDNLLCSDKASDTAANSGEMMYACAKCSQTFKYLFCLVKHVKWHEDQKKIVKDPKWAKMRGSSVSQYICLHSSKKNIAVTEKKNRKAPKRLKS